VGHRDLLRSVTRERKRFRRLRVIAARDGTTVTVDQGGGNVQSLTLSQGQFQELHFKAGAHFTSNLQSSYAVSTGFLSSGFGQPSTCNWYR